MNTDLNYLIQNFVIRELNSEKDIADHLMIRQNVYQDEYSSQDPQRNHDLLPSDWNAKLIGVFHDNEQVGTIRVVTRQPNKLIKSHLDNINEKMKLDVTPIDSDILPSEHAFNVIKTDFQEYKNQMVELSRVAVIKQYRRMGLYKYLILSALGISILDNFQYCLYSCSNESAHLHSELLPVTDTFQTQQYDSGYPGFSFPKSSSAMVCDINSLSPKQLSQSILIGIISRYGIQIQDAQDICIDRVKV